MAGFQNSSGNKLYNQSNSPLPATTAQSAPVSTANPNTQYAAPSSQQQHPATPTSPASSNNSSPTQTSNSSPNGHHTGPARNTPTLHSNSAFSPYHNSIPAAHPTPVTTPTTAKPQLSQPHPSQEQTQQSTMMTTTSHIEAGANTLIYPPHTHFQNPPAPFWPQWNPLNNGTSGTVALQGHGASAFMPTTVGYGATPSIAQHTPRPKLTTTIWEDEGTLCYQVDARGICVARRQDNDMINGTKLLNVVGMSRGKRDGILKNEKGRVVVKVGAMHLKGVWITFQRAKTLAAQFKISDLLYPVFVDDPSIFLHNSYGAPITSTRIPSMGSQWRPHHPFSTINSTAYDTGRSWYPYGNGAMVSAAPPPPDHGASAYPHATANGAHEDDYGSYAVVNGQPQPQQSVVFQRSASYDVANNTPATITANSTPRTGTPVFANVKTEETTATPSAPGYYGRPGLLNLVSAAEVVGNGNTPQSGSPQLIGQKRGYDDSENDDYSSNSQSPPMAMHPSPLSNMATVNTMNVAAAGSFPSPLNASPNSSPGSSAFSNWHNGGHKRMKYEYPEATTPSSQQSSPRISGNYQQLPALANGSQGSTTGALATSTQTYANSSLQMVTNAQQGSPHHCSSAATANGPATGTTTPTTENLDRYFQDTAGEGARRYDQYRPRDDAGEALAAGGAWD